jgi:hypothetical protein
MHQALKNWPTPRHNRLSILVNSEVFTTFLSSIDSEFKPSFGNLRFTSARRQILAAAVRIHCMNFL